MKSKGRIDLPGMPKTRMCLNLQADTIEKTCLHVRLQLHWVTFIRFFFKLVQELYCSQMVCFGSLSILFSQLKISISTFLLWLCTRSMLSSSSVKLSWILCDSRCSGFHTLWYGPAYSCYFNGLFMLVSPFGGLTHSWICHHPMLLYGMRLLGWCTYHALEYLLWSWSWSTCGSQDVTQKEHNNIYHIHILKWLTESLMSLKQSSKKKVHVGSLLYNHLAS